MCLWGDGGLTLVSISDERMAEIEDMYAAAGLLPGLVFQSDVLAPAEGAQRQLTLNLGQADQALMLTDNLDGEAPAAEVGTWMATVYTVTVNLTGTVDSACDEPFDESLYGAEGLVLYPQSLDAAETND